MNQLDLQDTFKLFREVLNTVHNLCSNQIIFSQSENDSNGFKTFKDSITGII